VPYQIPLLPDFIVPYLNIKHLNNYWLPNNFIELLLPFEFFSGFFSQSFAAIGHSQIIINFGIAWRIFFRLTQFLCGIIKLLHFD
jgi:hypothetical protein